ncbi:MAG: hypothetical protein ACLTZY_07115 [Alistipes indistinctus]
MNVSEAQLYYFSPTHTSKRVGEAVAAGLQAARLVENDLTHTPADDAILPSSSVAVVAVPVYREVSLRLRSNGCRDFTGTERLSCCWRSMGTAIMSMHWMIWTGS